MLFLCSKINKDSCGILKTIIFIMAEAFTGICYMRCSESPDICTLKSALIPVCEILMVNQALALQ